MKNKITIPNMACNHCYTRIKDSLSLPEITNFVMDVTTKEGTIEYDENKITPEDITNIVKDIGYDLHWSDLNE